jgi:ABC-type multidrug transport system ATPase subunit
MDIQLNQVSKTYASHRHPGRTQALQPITTQLCAGVTGLLGPNGAGKSTLMNLLVGLVSPSQGEITINGKPLQKQAKSFYSTLGYLPQQFDPYPTLTVDEYLHYLAILKGIPGRPNRKARVQQTLEQTHLTEYQHWRIKSLSGGLRQRVGIAQALLNDPRVLILDEPTVGLDPEERLAFRNLLAGLAFGRTVLISSHIISDLSASCEALMILDRGRLIYTGPPHCLCKRARGKVWEARVAASQFEQFQATQRVITSRKEGNVVTARVLCSGRPVEDSVPIEPTLEDGYLNIRDEVQA